MFRNVIFLIKGFGTKTVLEITIFGSSPRLLKGTALIIPVPASSGRLDWANGGAFAFAHVRSLVSLFIYVFSRA